MKSSAYKTFEEWKADVELMHQHPNDTKFANYVARKTNNSPMELKRIIKEYLLDETFVTNPVEVMNKIAKDFPGYILMVKSKEDPWFRA